MLLDHPHKGTPAGLLIALGLVALTALLVALALLARRLGWGEERLAGPRHAWGEASYRASATWADFIDWIRPRPRSAPSIIHRAERTLRLR